MKIIAIVFAIIIFIAVALTGCTQQEANGPTTSAPAVKTVQWIDGNGDTTVLVDPYQILNPNDSIKISRLDSAKNANKIAEAFFKASQDSVQPVADVPPDWFLPNGKVNPKYANGK